MYFHKQQITQKITQISEQRHSHDKKYLDLQQMITNNKKYQISDLRNKFTIIIEQLNTIIRDNIATVDLLLYRSDKLVQDGIDMRNVKIRIQSVKEYFLEFKHKMKREMDRGEEIISSRERWEIKKYVNDPHAPNTDEEQSLLTSHATAKQATQIGRSVLQSLSNQGSRIEKVRDQMGSIVKNINFSGNLVQLMRTRSREDNRLIGLLTLGLVFWGIICLFVIKPFLRGTN